MRSGTGIGMAHHAGGRVVPQHAGDALVGSDAAVAADHHAGMLGEAHSDAAAMVQRHPGRAASGVEQREQGQSDTASEPSRMASVSRLGEATEPLSR
jgi:hypothetical protein